MIIITKLWPELSPEPDNQIIPRAQGHTFRAYPINSLMRHSFCFCKICLVYASFSPTGSDWQDSNTVSPSSSFRPRYIEGRDTRDCMMIFMGAQNSDRK